MKKYSDSEEQKQTVNEPAAAYGLDLNSLKVETVQSVMQIENPRIVQEIRDYALRLMPERPLPVYGGGVEGRVEEVTGGQ